MGVRLACRRIFAHVSPTYFQRGNANVFYTWVYTRGCYVGVTTHTCPCNTNIYSTWAYSRVSYVGMPTLVTCGCYVGMATCIYPRNTEVGRPTFISRGYTYVGNTWVLCGHVNMYLPRNTHGHPTWGCQSILYLGILTLHPRGHTHA